MVRAVRGGGGAVGSQVRGYMRPERSVSQLRPMGLERSRKRQTLTRATIWQGNCDVAAQTTCSNIAPLRITIPIQYPISNCPAKSGAASFQHGFLDTKQPKTMRSGMSGPKAARAERAIGQTCPRLGAARARDMLRFGTIEYGWLKESLGIRDERISLLQTFLCCDIFTQSRLGAVMKSVHVRLGFLLVSGAVYAQQYVISTVAGGVPPLTPTIAVNASIGAPQGVATDRAGNV